MIRALLSKAETKYEAAVQSRCAQQMGAWLFTPKGFIFVFAVMILTYVFQVSHHPGFHGDETSLLDIPYRTVVYHDYRYPLLFSDSYNAEHLRKYPPIMSMMLRTWWHEVVGVSSLSTRLFSGLMMAVLSTLFGFLALKRSGGNWKSAVMMLTVVGLNPAVITAARTMRFEQEIIFMGGLSFLLPLLFADPQHQTRSRMMWLVSGFCAAWAGMSHPWGMVFPVVLVIGGLFMLPALKQMDNLGWFDRLFFIGLGSLFPVMATAYQIFHDWPAFLDYVRDIKEFYAFREDALISYFLHRYYIPLDPDMLGRIVASVLQLHMTGFAATATKLAGIDVLPIGFLFQILFWSFIGAIVFYIRKKQAVDTRYMSLLALGFILMGLFYLPNQVYAIYAGVFVIVAAFFLQQEHARINKAMVVYALLCAVFTLSYIVFLAVAPSVRGTVTLDTRYQTFDDMGKALGLNKEEGIVYVDTSTWRAGGRNEKSYSDVIRGDKMYDPAALVVNAETFKNHTSIFGARDDAWRQPMEAVLSKNVLRGVVALQDKNTGYYYLMQGAADLPLLVSYFDKKGQERRFRAFYKGVIPSDQLLKPGWYIVLGLPSKPLDYKVLDRVQGLSVKYAQKGDMLVSVAIVEVDKEALLTGIDPSALVMFLTEGW